MIVAHAVNASVFVKESLNGNITFKPYVGERESTLPHAVFEETATLAVGIEPEILRLAHQRATGGVRLALREIPDHFFAHADPHCAQVVQLVSKAGIQ